MFGKNRKDEPSIYDEAIDKVLERMVAFDPIDAEYADMMEQLERLSKLKAERHKSRLDPNQMLLVAGNLLGILVIVAYEQKHVMASKAQSFILKAK